ncbi:hypothetical protein I79_006196 [Cricetulus griseus]|uniref:Uncharacterized protein n=1 Tax=Cricetulus griseus TaxID=10029 RepID=G3H770_CRIGR|nr:hypothetical protein I79_006196 [Cricetulus griseus]
MVLIMIQYKLSSPDIDCMNPYRPSLVLLQCLLFELYMHRMKSQVTRWKEW